MTHPVDLFPDYLLGLLDERALEQVEAHLASCARCQEEVARLGAPLVALTEALPQERPPERTWASLSARFAELKQAKLVGDEAFGLEQAEKVERESVTEPLILTKERPRFYPWLMAACLALVVAGSSLWWGIQTQVRYQQAQAERQELSDFLAQPNVQKVSLENVFETAGQPPVGSLLIDAQNQALFVLNSAAPRGSAYQAWGHVSADWSPESGDVLESLALTRTGVFRVDPTGFASLYLSLEPTGGSEQPTTPLAKVSLLAARADELIVITRPDQGASVSANRAVVTGELGEGVTNLRYRVNGGPDVEAGSAARRFSFTVTDLRPGVNTVNLVATSAAGELVSAALILNYEPD